MTEPTNKLFCVCGSVRFVRSEELSVSSPHPQFWPSLSYYVHCASCETVYMWNFRLQRWDRIIGGTRPNNVPDYFRPRGSYDRS